MGGGGLASFVNPGNRNIANSNSRRTANLFDFTGGLTMPLQVFSTPEQRSSMNIQTSEDVATERAISDVTAANAKAVADAQAIKDKAASQAAASITNKKRAIARSQSVYTSPLGVSGAASTARKQLLGQ